MTLVMILVAGVLASLGTYLVLGRQLSRVVVGIGLLGHAVNILLVTSGGDGGDPAFHGGDPGGFADPLPQAFVLTAIVISFGVISFLLALAHRSWEHTGDDEVEDDLEDRMVGRRGTGVTTAGDPEHDADGTA